MHYTKDPGATCFLTLQKSKNAYINEFLLIYWYIPLKICLALHSKKHKSDDFYPNLVESGTEMNVYDFVSSNIHTNPAAIYNMHRL